jgi:hypothetical protein
MREESRSFIALNVRVLCFECLMFSSRVGHQCGREELSPFKWFDILDLLGQFSLLGQSSVVG